MKCNTSWRYIIDIKSIDIDRTLTYQHVGQVFDSEDNPRYLDIDNFIRGVPIPSSCRKHPEWIYG